MIITAKPGRKGTLEQFAREGRGRGQCFFLLFFSIFSLGFARTFIFS